MATTRNETTSNHGGNHKTKAKSNRRAADDHCVFSNKKKIDLNHQPGMQVDRRMDLVPLMDRVFDRNLIMMSDVVVFQIILFTIGFLSPSRDYLTVIDSSNLLSVIVG